jgi:glycosyltransferase involved in cell wall biosynthesis
VVRDQVTGLLVPPRDAAALAGALARLIANPELRRAFGASARALAETTFAAPLINRQIVDVYRRMGQT